MVYFYIVFAIYIVLTKIVVNTDADVQGNFSASTAGYIVAILILIFILLIVYKKINCLKYLTKNFFFMVPFMYYINALIFSFLSLLPVLSLFRSINGIGFVFIGAIVGKYLKKYTFEIRLLFFYKLLLVVFISGLVGNLLYSFFYIKNFSIWHFQAGYVALISIYLALWHLLDFFENRKKKDFVIFAVLFVITSFLHSFSAYISFYVAFIFILFYKRKFISFLILFLIPIVISGFVIDYLNSNLDSLILGKPAAAYLVGSGRFDIYAASFDAFSSLDIVKKIVGVGFMSERNILSSYDLTWSTDPHNSFIVSLLGTGIIGAFLYIVFILIPFFMKSFLIKNTSKNIFLKWITMHILFTVYGITSSSYLAVPSMQLILFIIFSYIVFKRRYNNV